MARRATLQRPPGHTNRARHTCGRTYARVAAVILMPLRPLLACNALTIILPASRSTWNAFPEHADVAIKRAVDAVPDSHRLLALCAEFAFGNVYRMYPGFDRC